MKTLKPLISQGFQVSVSILATQYGSGRRIRTLTYGVRVRCATFTQSRCVLTNKNYYTDFTTFVNSFFQKIRNLSAPRNLTGYSGGGSVWSAAAKKENASGKTGGFRIIWRFGCFGRWHTRRTGRGREPAAAMRVLYMYGPYLSTASVISAAYRRHRII